MMKIETTRKKDIQNLTTKLTYITYIHVHKYIHTYNFPAVCLGGLAPTHQLCGCISLSLHPTHIHTINTVADTCRYRCQQPWGQHLLLVEMYMYRLSETCFACCICLGCVAKSLSGFEFNPLDININPALLCHKRSSGSVVRVSDQ